MSSMNFSIVPCVQPSWHWVASSDTILYIYIKKKHLFFFAFTSSTLFFCFTEISRHSCHIYFCVQSLKIKVLSSHQLRLVVLTQLLLTGRQSMPFLFLPFYSLPPLRLCAAVWNMLRRLKQLHVEASAQGCTDVAEPCLDTWGEPARWKFFPCLFFC